MKATLTVLFMCISAACFAQVGVSILMKNNGTVVNSIDSADFVRTVSPPDSTMVLYSVMDYYKSGKIKLTAGSSQAYPVKFEGVQTTYYENGARKSKTIYSAGKITGSIYLYYPNGKVYIVKTLSEKDQTDIIVANYDSLGKQLTDHGNGYYTAYDDSFKNIAAEGTLKDGKPNGTWTIYNADGKHVETYLNSKFISGITVTNTGDRISYTKREIAPEFKGGYGLFYKMLANHIQYPPGDRDSGLQGKVYVTFVVEKDGSLTNMRVSRSPSPAMAAEAMRVIALSPPWSPALLFGVAQRVLCTVPVNFSLGD